MKIKEHLKSALARLICENIEFGSIIKPLSNKGLNHYGGDREIWTLAPVSQSTPLAGAPLQPLEYVSKTLMYSWYYFFIFLSRNLNKIYKIYVSSLSSNEIIAILVHYFYTFK